FSTLKEKGLIYRKDVNQLYCEHDKRFLPDRFVKGACPKCGAEDQYGDVCEVCGASYNATDLVKPRCIICGKEPVIKKSSHYFFKLSVFSEKLKRWLLENKEMQSDIRNYVLSWIDKGLEDWCVSRDAPYFGFKIPGEEDKYYYVWLDAPIGYISSTENYCKTHGCSVNDYWKGKNTKIIHFIGKDIAYFHFLFWPAMLMSAGYNLPHNLIVHGFLTVDKEKMSKSRGTFIKAREYLDSGLNPEFLRYHYASSLTKTTTDIDLSFDDFKSRINTELVGNIANLAYRCLSFTKKHFDGRLGEVPTENRENVLAEEIRDLKHKIDKNYMECDFRSAVKNILMVGDIGNRYFQENAPWELVNKDKARCQEVLTFTANIVKNIAIMLKPILPEFAKTIEEQLGVSDLKWKDINFELENAKIGEPKIILRKIEKIELGRPPAEEESGDVDPFSRLDLRVAKIEKVEQHPDADKLYIEHLDVGELGKRQIVSGLKGHYEPKELEGKKIIIVANLKPAKLRGVMSQGMLLAAESKEGKLGLLTSKDEPGAQVFVEGIEQKPAKEVNIKEFSKIKMLASDGKILYKGNVMKTKKGEITTDRKVNGPIG
ncbi:MAG: methionine--tRNA ligase, partial [Candidatus Micrarchaeota archaeon]|nr:methionine--tRNA ligase [Candidatus Micrarchaeota archaeon]